MDIMEAREAKRPLREGILPLPKEGLANHHRSKIFVEVPGGSGPIRKEIGELSQAEIRTLEPGLRISVVNCLLERYVVGQGQNELLMGRHPNTRDIRSTAPADLHSTDVICIGTGVA
jgi:hypothetical protein